VLCRDGRCGHAHHKPIPARGEETDGFGARSLARFRYAAKHPVLVRVRLVEGVDGYGPAVSNERRIWPPPR